MYNVINYFDDINVLVTISYICPLQITVDSDRTVVALYKFIKKHASIPFKLQKPDSTTSVGFVNKEGTKSSTSSDVKDEL